MAAPTTVDEAVTQALLQPQSVSESGRTIVNRSLKELQDARDRESAAKSKKNLGLRFTQLVPPAAG
jgi:hypothetical protein